MRHALCLILLAGLVTLNGCVVSDYKPGAGSDIGYYDRRIKENYYEVSFKGDKHTDLEEAYDFAVLRGLEIGRGLGYEYMLLESVKDSTKTRSSQGCIGFKDGVCTQYSTFRASLPGYKIKVRYFERPPKGRFLPEKLFPIRSSYVTFRHKYRLDR